MLPDKLISPLNGSDLGYPAWAWPGGYPIFYICQDDNVLCVDCANGKNGSEASSENDDPEWHLIGSDINWENESLYCVHCDGMIPSAYGDD